MIYYLFQSPVDTHNSPAYADANKEEEKHTEPLIQQEPQEDKPEEIVEPEGPPQPGL